jgi:hypothetical protein
MMKNLHLLVAISAAFAGSATFAVEKEGMWAADWPDLSESGHMSTHARVEGVVEGKNQRYTIDIATRVVSTRDLKSDPGMKYYGLDRRSSESLNTQMTGLELILGVEKMKVPENALFDILNPLIAETMRTIFDAKRQIEIIVINGPDGAEGYMVAFIFENGRFSRRQIRPNIASRTGWHLLEDKTF